MSTLPMDTPIRHDPRTAKLCTAHKRRTGEPCRAIAVKGMTTCKFHGGRSLRGTAHPSTITGRYSRDLPTRIAARAEEALSNPRLLSLRDDIAVAEALLAEKLEALATGESAQCWHALKGAMESFSAALAVGDMAGMSTHFAAMRDLVTQGSATAGVQTDLLALWDRRTKLVATEVKTLQTMQQMVTTQQMMLWLHAITDTVTQAVQAHTSGKVSRTILQAIQSGVSRLAMIEEGHRA